MDSTPKTYLTRIDTDTTGNRCDVTPLFQSADDFAALVDDLCVEYVDESIDCVACIDALGFILGTAVARKLGVGVIPIRKGGKLPVATVSRSFRDYTGKTKSLEIRKDALQTGMRLLVVDEWIETGAQVSATIELIESQGSVVVGIATINIDDNEQTRGLKSNYRVTAVWQNCE